MKGKEYETMEENAHYSNGYTDIFYVYCYL